MDAMKTLRLADGQRFRIEGFGNAEFWFDRGLYSLMTDDDGGADRCADSSVLLFVLDNPDSIVRRPALSENDRTTLRVLHDTLGIRWITRDWDGALRMWTGKPALVSGGVWVEDEQVGQPCLWNPLFVTDKNEPFDVRAALCAANDQQGGGER